MDFPSSHSFIWIKTLTEIEISLDFSDWYFLFLFEQENGKRSKRSTTTNTNACFEYSPKNRSIDRIFNRFNGTWHNNDVSHNQQRQYKTITIGLWWYHRPRATIHSDRSPAQQWFATTWCDAINVSQLLKYIFKMHWIYSIYFLFWNGNFLAFVCFWNSFEWNQFTNVLLFFSFGTKKCFECIPISRN